MNTPPLPSEALVEKLVSLVADECRTQLEFLMVLAELEERKVPLELGYPSTWAFLTKRVGLSEGSARRRIVAARLLVRFPVIAHYLAPGRVNLTTLGELRDVLDEHNVEAVLEKASGLSEDGVRRLVATLRTREQAPLLPVATPVAAGAAATPVASATPSEQGQVAPLAEPALERFQLIVTRQFLDDLDEVKSLLSHRFPGNTSEVVHEALRLAKAVLLKRKLGHGGVGRKRKEGSRHIPTAVKRPVWERDGGKCTFVGEGGQVCGSRFQVEFQHSDPHARGGAATVENVTTFCSLHNQLAAEKDFGKEYVERRRVEADVLSALVNLGFTKEQARKGIAQVRDRARHDVPELLREALRALNGARVGVR